jgi:hypothetical protein
MLHYSSGIQLKISHVAFSDSLKIDMFDCVWFEPGANVGSILAPRDYRYRTNARPRNGHRLQIRLIWRLSFVSWQTSKPAETCSDEKWKWQNMPILFWCSSTWCWWVWGFLYLCEFGISFIWLEFTINGLGFWRMPLKRKMCWSLFGYSRHIGSVQNCLWMMMLVGLYYPFYRDHHNPWTGQSHGLMDTTDTTMVVTSIAWNLTPTTSYNYGYVTRLRRTAP